MQKTNASLASVREDLLRRRGSELKLSVKTTRGRRVTMQGRLRGAYPNVFVMETQKSGALQNVDIICGKVELLDERGK